MSSGSRVWIVVAAIIVGIEALKDQRTKSKITSSALSDKIKRSKEESMSKVMDLSCWGPSTVKF
jgi:hypothetical protein